MQSKVSPISKEPGETFEQDNITKKKKDKSKKLPKLVKLF